MFKVERTAPNRIDMQLSGKLNSEQMEEALDHLVTASEGIENGKMLYDIIDFHVPSLGAIAVEFKKLPSMFSLIGRFNRAAVLSDKEWLKKISEIEGMLYPGLEIKAFDRDERDIAIAWLEAKDKKSAGA